MGRCSLIAVLLCLIIIGYSLGHGRINSEATTAVAGSVCLHHPMQMGQSVKFQKSGKKSDVVDSGVLKELVKDLAMNFFAHADAVPERIIIFRDGGSTGSFDNIKNEEVKAVKEAFAEMNMECGRECPQNCEDRNCPMCAPPLTFIVSNKASPAGFVSLILFEFARLTLYSLIIFRITI